MRYVMLAPLAMLAMAGCGGAPSGGTSPSATPTASSSPTPTATPTSTPTSTPTPTTAPTPTATAVPSWSIHGGSTSRATITDLRTGQSTGRNRLVVEFTTAVPAYEMEPNPTGPGSTQFAGTFSGLPITVAGSFGVRLEISNVDQPNTYPQGNDLKPGYTVLAEVRVIGDFEGRTDIAIGLNSNVVPTVTELASPPRLVIDFPTG